MKPSFRPNFHIDNNGESLLQEGKEVLSVILVEDVLRIPFLVQWNDPDTLSPGQLEFQVINIGQLYLTGIDRIRQKNNQDKDKPFAYNPNLEDNFKDILGKYHIKINNIVIHDIYNYESNDYVIDETIKFDSGKTVKEELYDLIDKFCKTVKYKK